MIGARLLVRTFAVPIVVIATAAHAGAAAPRLDAARRGADWIASEQQDDGGFFASGQRVDQTADALAALVAGGSTGRPVKRALAYVRRHGSGGVSRGAYTGRIVAALVAAGEDPRSFGGTDFVRKLTDQYDERTGAYDAENLFSDLQGANGALAAGSVLPDGAVDHIYANACSDGGFGYENGCTKGADVDTTAWAINVLVGAGRRNDAQVASARGFLLSVQQPDGGFGFTKAKATSADSTGLVLSAIEALGEKATAAPWRQSDGDDPVKALLSLQNSDGSFRFVASARKGNALSTTNAVPGLAGVAYPVPPRDVRSTAGSEPAAPSAPPVGNGVTARTITGSGGSATAAPASPSASPPVTIEALAPFADTAAQDTEGAGGLPASAVWGGLAALAGAAGGGAWWLHRRSTGA